MRSLCGYCVLLILAGLMVVGCSPAATPVPPPSGGTAAAPDAGGTATAVAEGSAVAVVTATPTASPAPTDTPARTATPMPATTTLAASPTTPATATHTAAPDDIPTDLQSYLDEQERQVLVRALRDADFNRTAAAQRLGLNLRQMRYRIQRLGIVMPGDDEV